MSQTVISGKYLMGLGAGENELNLRDSANGVYHLGLGRIALDFDVCSSCTVSRLEL